MTPEQVHKMSAAFNSQLREYPVPVFGATLEHDAFVTRVLSDSWNGVIWSNLSENTAEAVVAREITRFKGRPWEWKVYSGDEPGDLPQRLVAAGFAPDPTESVMIAHIAEIDLEPDWMDAAEIVTVATPEDVASVVSLHNQVFGGNHEAMGRELAAALATSPPAVTAVLARVGPRPVSSGRVEFNYGTDFASLWGGGTLPEWRRRGLFRALVAQRAALAAERGFQYLQVDALPASQPILARLGFVEIATSTPYRFLNDDGKSHWMCNPA